MKEWSLCQFSPKTTWAFASRTISKTSGASGCPVATACGSSSVPSDSAIVRAKRAWSWMVIVGFWLVKTTIPAAGTMRVILLALWAGASRLRIPQIH